MVDFVVAELSAEIPAFAGRVYDILADYREGHPAILPEAYFKSLEIEQGGHGEGTIILVELSVMGVKRRFRMRVTEPEPGRLLTETDDEAGVTTRFTVDDIAPDRCRVTIRTESRRSRGVMGLIEKWTGPSMSRRIFREELRLLADYVSRE